MLGLGNDAGGAVRGARHPPWRLAQLRCPVKASRTPKGGIRLAMCAPALRTLACCFQALRAHMLMLMRRSLLTAHLTPAATRHGTAPSRLPSEALTVIHAMHLDTVGRAISCASAE
jgi:hypothetical protein